MGWNKKNSKFEEVFDYQSRNEKTSHACGLLNGFGKILIDY
jgi:hypothetical protein